VRCFGNGFTFIGLSLTVLVLVLVLVSFAIGAIGASFVISGSILLSIY
jgi:hypothetical protein